MAENVTSATTHVTKVEERAEPRLVPLLCLVEGKCVSAADGEGGILRDADREEDHHHRRRRRGPGAGGGAPHLAAHVSILTAVPCFPSGPGYCNTGSEAAASRHAGDQGGCCQGNGIVHRGSPQCVGGTTSSSLQMIQHSNFIRRLLLVKAPLFPQLQS